MSKESTSETTTGDAAAPSPSDKTLWSSKHIAVKQTATGFQYLERQGRDSIAVFLIRRHPDGGGSSTKHEARVHGSGTPKHGVPSPGSCTAEHRVLVPGSCSAEHRVPVPGCATAEHRVLVPSGSTPEPEVTVPDSSSAEQRLLVPGSSSSTSEPEAMVPGSSSTPTTTTTTTHRALPSASSAPEPKVMVPGSGGGTSTSEHLALPSAGSSSTFDYEVLVRLQPLCIDSMDSTLHPCPITGSIDAGELPGQAAAREALEESGYAVQALALGRYLVGTQTNEACHMFYADVSGQQPQKATQDGTFFESISRCEWRPLSFLEKCDYSACQIGYFRLRGVLPPYSTLPLGGTQGGGGDCKVQV